MVIKCVVTNCTTGYKTYQKKASFYFHEDQELRIWIYFVIRKDWLPTAHSVICINHFEEKFIKHCKKRQHMFQLSCSDREAYILREQLPSSRFFLKSPVLRWSWLECQIFMNFSRRSQFLQTRCENLGY